MILRGTASPEGPYKWNRTLSHLRRQSLLDLISSNVKYPIDSLLTVEEVTEDYLYLQLLMKERGDKDYERVAAVIDKYIDIDLQPVSSLDIDYHQVGSPNGTPAFMSPVYPLLPANIFGMKISPRREFLSVKTNLLFDLAYMPGYERFCPVPNIAVELICNTAAEI